MYCHPQWPFIVVNTLGGGVPNVQYFYKMLFLEFLFYILLGEAVADVDVVLTWEMKKTMLTQVCKYEYLGIYIVWKIHLTPTGWREYHPMPFGGV